MNEPFEINNLGECKITSPLSRPEKRKAKESWNFIDDNAIVMHQAVLPPHENLEVSPRPFQAAGPREKIYFDPSKTRVGIVTCGGLCPGLNNVIRTIVMQMFYTYGVPYVYGFRYGYQGFIPKYGHNIKRLTPEKVKNIHVYGGSIISSSRGHQDVVEIVDCLERENISILYCIGGDGTLKGAHQIALEVQKRNIKISVIGIPKTIDNDIKYCVKTFGFETAFTKAVDSIHSAHTEAYGYPYGVVLVKLMGRDSGFIAANTVLGCPDVNFVLVPEVPFALEGKNGFLNTLEKYLRNKAEKNQHPHAVIVVAEGAGQELMNPSGDKDESGNIKYGDIGKFLSREIKEYFKDRLPVSFKYIEPSYMIRSLPANPHDAIFCYYLADHAVHAGMAGKTDMMVGFWNGHFTHVPLEEVAKGRKQIDPTSDFWRQVLFSTGQPPEMI